MMIQEIQPSINTCGTFQKSDLQYFKNLTILSRVRKQFANGEFCISAAALLREQIAKAQAEGKIRVQERRPMNDQYLQRRSPPVKPTHPPVALRQQTASLSAISREDPLIKNEIVEKYLESQTELRARMERQALDAVANNEIEDELVGPNKKSLDEDDSKKKKRKDKKKKEGSAEKSGPVFPSETEILSRLPPIDPDILAEFQNFTFYESPDEEEVVKESHPDNKETDNLQNKTASLSSNDQQPASLFGGVTNAAGPAIIEQPKKLFATKIDWGDSDDDEDFEEVKTPVNEVKEDQVDSAPLEEAVVLPILLPDESQTIPENHTNQPDSILTDVQEEVKEEETKVLIEEEIIPVPLREVDESEVERLHSEQIESLNGNKDKDGQFREWQETVTMESITGDLLHILPYTIIDF